MASKRPTILLVSDSPYATTGLGRVSKYLIRMLPEYKWVVWGFLHPTYKVSRGVSTPIYGKEYGDIELLMPKTYTDNQFGIEFVPELVSKVKPDYVLTSMDYDRILPIAKQLKELQFTQSFKWVNYFPMDREDFKAKEVEAYRFPDINVCITKFGQQKLNALAPGIGVQQIWHPIDAEEFPEVFTAKGERDAFRDKTWKGIKPSDFLLGSVSRSFARKDTPRLVVAITEILRRNPDAWAYIHGAARTFEGTDLRKLAFECDVPPKKLAFLPDNILETEGVPGEILNKIYHSLDLLLSVSGGEGFGYSAVEALLCEVPVIGPKNTSFPELVQDFGYLVDPVDSAFHHNGSTSMWPIVSVKDVVSQVEYVKANYQEAKEKAQAGRQWVLKNLSLDTIAKQWRKILA